MPSTPMVSYIVIGLIAAVLIYSVIYAFAHQPKEKSISDHIRIVRRSIGAAFILGFILTCYSQSNQKKPEDWQYGGPLLMFISALNYGYARKAEKAALILERTK